MKDFLKEVKEYFENTPQDKVKSDWDKYEEFDQVGPTVDEFLDSEVYNGKRPPNLMITEEVPPIHPAAFPDFKNSVRGLNCKNIIYGNKEK